MIDFRPGSKDEAALLITAIDKARDEVGPPPNRTCAATPTMSRRHY
jgi:hypothetical protein